MNQVGREDCKDAIGFWLQKLPIRYDHAAYDSHEVEAGGAQEEASLDHIACFRLVQAT